MSDRPDLRINKEGNARYSTNVRMPQGEEAIPVRTTDLDHLKRDIRQLPEGDAKFSNAFWGFIGIGVPLILQFFISWISSKSFEAGYLAYLALGVFSVAVGFLCRWLGKDAESNRTQAKDRIIENIDDFRANVTPPEKHWGFYFLDPGAHLPDEWKYSKGE